ncbi:hypothetical protein D3P07_17345 [Paenibacillus sp. 1011MAR3C5]|nr:hypothetical protein D3P07_17345 [Paenibacillus sp. 1011MAR3C5]
MHDINRWKIQLRFSTCGGEYPRPPHTFKKVNMILLEKKAFAMTESFLFLWRNGDKSHSGVAVKPLYYRGQ